MATTSYKILCHDMKVGGVIGKSGSIIKSIRQHTGAFINVHEPIPGDEERIIEISDTRRRDPEGRIPSFSPAQEALLLVHERILDNDVGFGTGDEDDEYGPRGGANRVATRLVVSRMHVGSLLGKGGKIIEQMRMETKTHIRILPRDQTLPRCVSMSEELVQVVGDVNAVKNAIANISSRLRESQHRDRIHFQGRPHSPDHYFSPDDEFSTHMHNAPHRSSIEVPFGSRISSALSSIKNTNYAFRPPGYTFDSGAAPKVDSSPPLLDEVLVFRILCPIDKVDCVVSESDGIIELLRDEIGVDVKVTDPVAGSEELIITISSQEGPDDELFPAQEALLHIQTRIVDLVPAKDNIISTRLLVPSSEARCLEGKDGSLTEIRRLTAANIQILPRELPGFISGTDVLVQIAGEIKAARDALVEVTSRLRSNLYREFFQKDTLPPLPPPPPPPPTLLPRFPAASPVGSAFSLEASLSNNIIAAREGETGSEQITATYQNVPAVATVQSSRDSVGPSEVVKQNESDRSQDGPSLSNRIPPSLLTRSILEVVIPEHAVKLITRSKNKLAQINELSGANITLVDDGTDGTEKTIQISGSTDQAERARSLLQGFILSAQEDGP